MIILSLPLCLPPILFADNAKLKEHFKELEINNLDRIKKDYLIPLYSPMNNK